MDNGFSGLRTRTIASDHLRVEFLIDAGPRIVRLFLQGSNENWLAEVPSKKVTTPHGEFFFRGGHRLWYAPEEILHTYRPDNDPPTIEELAQGICLHQSVEPHTGVRKSIEIHLAPDRAALTLTHRIENRGGQSIELAPWAITMLRLGGVAILPQSVGVVDECGLLPNRHLTLWPYTRINDPRLELGDAFIRIHARPQLPPCKIGYLNRSGWIAYWREHVLFVKRFVPHADRPHFDSNCNAEVYCNDEFIELETLAPLVRLEPGLTIAHDETWEFYSSAAPESLPSELMK